MSGCSDCIASMARRLPLSQVLFALLGFHLQPSKFGSALPVPLPLSDCLAALLTLLSRYCTHGTPLVESWSAAHKQKSPKISEASSRVAEEGQKPRCSWHRPCTMSPQSPAPVEMACPGYSDATEPHNPWQTVQETFCSKLFILIQLRERGAESYNVLVWVQSPV